MNKFIKGISLAALVGVASVVNAQSVSSLEINPDARALGMAGASVALEANAFAAFSNTSAISFAPNSVAASYGYSDWYGNNKMHAVGSYFQLNNKHAVALGVRYLDGATIHNTEDGVTFSSVNPHDLMLDLGYAYRLNSTMSVSANMRYIDSKINEGPGIDNGRAFAMDFGFTFQKDAYSAGLSLNGLGTKVDYGFEKYRMPTRLLGGGAYTYTLASAHKFTGTIEGEYRFMPSDYSHLGGAAGLEYTYHNIFSLRGGYRVGDKEKSAGNYGVIGCGANLGFITADFAYVLAKHDCLLKDVWQVSVGIKF